MRPAFEPGRATADPPFSPAGDKNSHVVTCFTNPFARLRLHSAWDRDFSKSTISHLGTRRVERCNFRLEKIGKYAESHPWERPRGWDLAPISLISAARKPTAMLTFLGLRGM